MEKGEESKNIIDINKPLQLANGDPHKVVLYTDKGANKDYPLVGAVVIGNSVNTLEWSKEGVSKTDNVWSIVNKPPQEPYTILLDEEGVAQDGNEILVKVNVDSEGKVLTITVGEDWNVIVNGGYKPNWGSGSKPKGPFNPSQPRGDSKSLSEAYFQGVGNKSSTTGRDATLWLLDDVEV